MKKITKDHVKQPGKSASHLTTPKAAKAVKVVFPIARKAIKKPKTPVIVPRSHSAQKQKSLTISKNSLQTTRVLRSAALSKKVLFKLDLPKQLVKYIPPPKKSPSKSCSKAALSDDSDSRKAKKRQKVEPDTVTDVNPQAKQIREVRLRNKPNYKDEIDSESDQQASEGSFKPERGKYAYKRVTSNIKRGRGN